MSQGLITESLSMDLLFILHYKHVRMTSIGLLYG